MAKKASVVLVVIIFISIALISLKDILLPEPVAASMASALFRTEKRVVADGTFIQWWLVKDWDDSRWTKEFEMLREAGMQYVVFAPTAFYIVDENTGEGQTHTIYPTKEKGFRVFKDEEGREYPDIVDACLRNAEKAGIKVFLGLNFSDDWWQKRLDSSWVYARMEEGNRVADELWDNYYHKYPGAFYGWYWCWEVDNFFFTTIDLFRTTRDMLAKAIKIHMDHFDTTGKHLPFMLSPFMDWKLGKPQSYAKMWEYVLANSGMREGDILCPQDSIGTGGLRLNNLDEWFSELRKAVDVKPGLELWANIETFDDTDWTAATMDRFVAQMKEITPYVDNILTFSYSHYYSPFNVDPGFHRTYVEYVKKGRLEKSIPSVPTGLEAAAESSDAICLIWNRSEDNVGVCGYYVYRNGEMIANIQVDRDDSYKPDNFKIDSFKYGKEPDVQQMVDRGLEPGTTYYYEVQAYDFAGNVSKKASLFTTSFADP